jgi:hypothetical protein
MEGPKRTALFTNAIDSYKDILGVVGGGQGLAMPSSRQLAAQIHFSVAIAHSRLYDCSSAIEHATASLDLGAGPKKHQIFQLRGMAYLNSSNPVKVWKSSPENDSTPPAHRCSHCCRRSRIGSRPWSTGATTASSCRR